MKTEIKLTQQSGCMKWVFIITYAGAIFMLFVSVWAIVFGDQVPMMIPFWFLFIAGELWFIWYFKIFVFPFNYRVDAKKLECCLYWKGFKLFKIKTSSIHSVEIKYIKLHSTSESATEFHNFGLNAVLKKGKKKKMLFNQGGYLDQTEALEDGYALASKIIEATLMSIPISYHGWADDVIERFTNALNTTSDCYAQPMQIDPV